jgi:hypothetical protein
MEIIKKYNVTKYVSVDEYLKNDSFVSKYFEFDICQ